MKPEFYDRSKRANVYNTIYVYKIISLIILVILTIILIILFSKDKALFHTLSKASTPAFFVVVVVCIVMFILSIIIDFYILGRTASIGRRLNKLAYIDHLTGLPNRYSCDLLIQSFNDSDRLPTTGFILMQISNLKNVNDNDGHTGGNWLISEFCSMLEDISEGYGYVGRNGGNEFILLMENCDSTQADMFLLDLTKRIRGYNEMNVGNPLEVSYSKVLNCEEQLDNISRIVSLGYKRINDNPLTLS